jgi:hypothetical protein
MTKDKFWLIWSPQGTVNPTDSFYSKGLAQQKARELASAIQESDFYIVEATHHYKADINVIETSFDATSEESLVVDPRFKVGDKIRIKKETVLSNAHIPDRSEIGKIIKIKKGLSFVIIARYYLYLKDSEIEHA